MKYFRGILVFVGIMLTLPAEAKDIKSFLDSPMVTFYNASDSRVVNGTAAYLGQFPYQLYLTGYKDTEGTDVGYHCGAVIIAPNWALTAAHCLYVESILGSPVGSIGLLAGAIDINNPGAFAQEKLIVANGNIYYHENYNDDTLVNDIGVIRVSAVIPILGIPLNPFDLSGDYVKAVRLPSSSLNIADYVGQTLTVSGYGRVVTDGDTSSILLWATETVVTHTECQADYPSETIPPNILCSKDRTPPISSICQGDSGGPATLQVGSRTTLAGVVSFTTDTCGALSQGYTDVSKYVDWIEDNTDDSLLL